MLNQPSIFSNSGHQGVPAPAKQRSDKSTSGAIEHIRSFMSAIKQQLADDQWHAIGVTEFCQAHTIANNMFDTLISLSCIESRPKKIAGKQAGSRSREFRQLPGLQQVTITMIATEKSRLKKESLLKMTLKREPQATPAPPPNPAPIADDSVDKPGPAPEPPMPELPPVNQFLLLTLNSANEVLGTLGHPFASVDAAEDYLVSSHDRTKYDGFMIVSVIDVLRPTMIFTRSKTI